MKNHVSPRKRVELALQKKFVDKVPFTVYGNCWSAPSIENPIPPSGKFLPQSTVERYLRNRGLCIVDLTYWGYKIVRPNVKVISTAYQENGRFMVRNDYETPVGDLYTMKEITDYTVWSHKKMFASKEDYKKILFLIEDAIVLPEYEYGFKLLNILGEDVILRGDLGLEPLQELITGEYFKTEDFSIQWMDNRDEIIKLYNAVTKLRRYIYKIVAESPIYFICYGGNVIPTLISPENFEKYYCPHYEEAAEVLHKKNKVLGCHFDADIKQYKNIISKTSLDVIEAFTPYPDTQMTTKEAKEAWKDKILWINFPSSLHLAPHKKIEEATINIINEGGPEGLIIGITEDVPENRWQENFLTIMKTIDTKFNQPM